MLTRMDHDEIRNIETHLAGLDVDDFTHAET